MKQYRPLLLIIIILMTGWTLLIQDASAQQLKQIQKGTDRNQIPVTNGYQNTQVYRNAIPYILDTLGIRDSICCLDSIYLRGDSLILLKNGSGQVYKSRIYNHGSPDFAPWYYDLPNPQKYDIWVPDSTEEEYTYYYDGSTWKKMIYDIIGNEGVIFLDNVPSYNNAVDIRSTGIGLGSKIKVQGDTLLRVSYDEIVPVLRLNIDTETLNDLVGGGSTQYLNPYIIGLDTVGAILTEANDTLLFVPSEDIIDTTGSCCAPSIGNDTLYIGDYYVVLPSGEATTVGDTPTINMTLTGVNITGEVIDGSITPAKLDRTYLETEVDGSTTNEIELPSQTGNSGKYLSTNGTSPSWETVSGGSSKALDRLASDFATTATSLQTTDIAYTFPSTGLYHVVLMANFQTSNTNGGIKAAYAASGGLAYDFISGYIRAPIDIFDATTERVSSFATITSGVNTTGVNPSGSPHHLQSDMLINVTTAGTITLKFASESGSYTATLNAGSTLIIEKLN